MQAIAILLAFAIATLPTQRAADQFHKVKLMVNTGGKSEPANVVLFLENDRVVIRSKDGGAELKNLAYADIRAAEYSFSKSPRWKSGVGAAIAVGVFALPIFFMKGKKHWLTVHGKGDFALLQLDKNNYKIVLPAFEARSGIKVETVAEEK